MPDPFDSPSASLRDAARPGAAGIFDSAAAFFQDLQRDICNALVELDAGGKEFGADAWQRPGGGGGLTRVLEGGLVFEKAGVSFSNVLGELPAELAEHMPGTGRAFRAAGISLVLHPRSPMAPTTHANFRCIAKGDVMWFGGGADLTPYYFHREDAVHFHRTLADACDRHKPVGDYDRFKAWCDEYFFLPHRAEARGIGGVFFDYVGSKGEHRVEDVFAFVQDLGRAFVPAYVPIVRRRMGEPYGDLERAWHLQRRGRYVEFNLLYDRGTLFGLKTSGRIESILMSLPPLVRWDYDVMPQPGSPEAALLAALRPTNWLER